MDLEVDVEEADDPAARDPHAVAHGAAAAGVARVEERPHRHPLAVLVQDALDRRAGAVGRAVIDEHQLERPDRPLERGQHLEHARLEVRLLVVAGDDDR